MIDPVPLRVWVAASVALSWSVVPVRADLGLAADDICVTTGSKPALVAAPPLKERVPDVNVVALVSTTRTNDVVPGGSVLLAPGPLKSQLTGSPVVPRVTPVGIWVPSTKDVPVMLLPSERSPMSPSTPWKWDMPSWVSASAEPGSLDTCRRKVRVPPAVRYTALR